jgi:hypothetical protein
LDVNRSELLSRATSCVFYILGERFVYLEQKSKRKLAKEKVREALLAGGDYHVAPRALLDDGLLDVMVIVDVDVRKFGVLLSD